MIIKTCKNCLDREIGCHSSCERYLKEREKVDAINKKALKEKDTAWLLDNTLYNGKRKRTYKKD